MPRIIEYLGLIIYCYTDDHYPVHFHAVYNNAVVKVTFFIKEGKIYRTTYTPVSGKMPVAKLRDIKKVCEAYKYKMLDNWIDIQVKGVTKVRTIKITTRIR